VRKNRYTHTHTTRKRKRGKKKTYRDNNKERIKGKRELYRGIVWSGIRVLEVVGLILEKFFNFKLYTSNI